MIFRRIKSHIQKENWFAVFIDFAIVVVGVFIGLQVANWNETRGDRATETLYLSDLRENLVEDRAEYANVTETITARIGAINFVLTQAIGDTTPTGIALPIMNSLALGTDEIPFPNAPMPLERNYSSLWTTINFIRIADSKSGTYNALVGSGDIGLIRDQEMVGKMHTYYRLSGGISEVQDKFFSFGDDGLIGAGRRYGLSPYERVEADRLIALVRDNPEFAVYLRQSREQAALQAGLILGSDRRAEQLVTMIDGDKP